MISFLNFAMIIEQKSLDVFLNSEKKKEKKDYNNNIYYFYIYIECSQYIYKKKKKQLNLKMGEQWQLVDNIFKQSSTSSTLPYFLEIEEFLTNLIPLICRSFLD